MKRTALIAVCLLTACKSQKLPPATYDPAPFVPTKVTAELAPRPKLIKKLELDGAESGKRYFYDAAAISPNERFFAAAFKHTSSPTEGRLGLWSLEDGARAWLSEDWVWSEGCDFHPDGTRIYCAHQPRPDWSKTELLVIDAANGKTLDRIAVPTKAQKAQPEPWWGDSARVSPDGKWAGLSQLLSADGESQVAIIAIKGAKSHEIVATFPNSFPDEVVFTPDGRTMYCSDFKKNALQRFRYDGSKWNADGDLPLGMPGAGIDLDGKGQVVVNGFFAAKIAIVTPSAKWMESQVRLVEVEGQSYELCADPRPGAGFAWSISQNGAAQAIDTAAGKVIGKGTVAPIDGDGTSMSCHSKSGTPYLVSDANVWTWTN